MLLSMTGFGEAQDRQDDLSVSVELRAINNRYLKTSIRCGEAYNSLEPQIEALVRSRIKRGTIQVTLRIDRIASEVDFQINEPVLRGYYRQMEQLSASLNLPVPSIENLLTLPGVIDDRAALKSDLSDEWPLIEKTLQRALEGLCRMRAAEGLAMENDFRENCRAIVGQLDRIERRAPEVALAYRERLLEKLNALLAELGTQLEPADVVREVGFFAERSDIAEEIVRLRSHLEQFETIMAREESAGRKLEFLIQEMFREINTIGSKANDTAISEAVVEVKASVERMREMIQNVE